jgi:hypothetical protein
MLVGFPKKIAVQYIVADENGAIKRWTAVAFADRQLVAIGNARPFVDSFTNGDVAHSDTMYNAWHKIGASGTESLHNAVESVGHLVLSNNAAFPMKTTTAIATTETVFNILRQASAVTAVGLRFDCSDRDAASTVFRVTATADTSRWNISLAVAANGHILLSENAARGRAVLYQSTLPANCGRQQSVSAVLFLDDAAWNISVGCSTGHRVTAFGRYADGRSHFTRVPAWTGSCGLQFDLDGGSASASLESIRAEAVAGVSSLPPKPPTLPVVLGPVVNGIELGDGMLGPSQVLAAKGFLDVTKPPFLADPTGVLDATAALQRAFDFGRQFYLTSFLPSGTYTVSATLRLTDPDKTFLTTVGTPFCNNMAEVWNAMNRTRMPHCSRTAPAVIQGSRKGARAMIQLAQGTNLTGPVLQMHNPENENINMNQVVSHCDIKILAGNDHAQGIYARGAQGTSVQDVTIFAGTAACGLVGGAGSGGSHINVTVLGGQIGIDVSQAQPAPTLVAVTLLLQLTSAIVYTHPGRQTLSIVGATIRQLPTATGPAILATAPLSVIDSVITTTAPAAQTIAVTTTGATFMRNVHIKGFGILVDPGEQGSQPVRPMVSSSGWTTIRTLALSAPFGSATTPIFLNGSAVGGANSTYRDVIAGSEPPTDIAAQHSWGPSFPSFESPGLCDAKVQYGAKGDYQTDDTAALQRALDDPACAAGVFLPKGYYAVSKTLRLPSAAVLVGASRIYTNIVPHASIAPHVATSTDAWPLVATASGPKSSATIYALSIIVWHHVNSTFALEWQCSTGYWREAHTNRVDVNPGVVGPGAHYAQPLNKITAGGGKFYNFYQVLCLLQRVPHTRLPRRVSTLTIVTHTLQENWEYQGAKYRHLLVTGGTDALHFYHLNTEHSQGEANTEFRGVRGPLKIFGFKGEGNYVQIWFSGCKSVFLSGYGGNASPFPFNCQYPPGYAQYPPSLFRLENVDSFVIANVITQDRSDTTSQCGLFNSGFSGNSFKSSTWRSIFEVSPSGNFSTPSLEWPVLYARGMV